jgi:uncharacterized NAD(P)/FAD-binding protein YdhS
VKNIVIIGGGFCGTVTAVNLARLSHEPFRIVVVNHKYPAGRGVAYSTKRPEHLLNVVARNMSALADDLSHFVEWLHTRHDFSEIPEAQLRESFVPRRIYGDYLLGLLHGHERPGRNRSGSTIEVIKSEAVEIALSDRGAKVSLADGRTLDADKVLLATGNPPPGELRVAGSAFSHPNYFNSWELSEHQLSNRTKSVLLLGTGLTMVDAFLTLTALNWEGQVTAVSRNGLLPQSHFQSIEYHDFPPPEPATLGLAQLASAIEEHCLELSRRGVNPALLVDKLRPYTQLIWRHFSADERQTFLKHYRARWNVNRHRIAQSVHQVVTQGIEQGRLQIKQGAISRMESHGDEIAVVTTSPNGEEQTVRAGLVLNCLGPQERFSTTRSPLLQNALATGLIAADDLDMGIRVTAEFAAIDRDGRPSNVIYAIGPMLKGTLWETIAVPELRVQSFQVAHILSGIPLRLNRPDPTWPAQAGIELMEYCI